MTVGRICFGGKHFAIRLAMAAAILVPAGFNGHPSAAPSVSPPAWFQIVDLSVGESQRVTLDGCEPVAVKLLRTGATRDRLRNAVREAWAEVEVNGNPLKLHCGNYNLPRKFGVVRLDCPFMSAYRDDFLGDYDPWGLEKDARIRIWPASEDDGLAKEFRYPLKQRWFAGSTQLGNEPVYVDGGDRPLMPFIYYHNGLDIGGAEGLAEVVAATGGLIVTVGQQVIAEMPDHAPVTAQYDSIYILDSRGWYHRYSHLHSIAGDLTAGQRVNAGDLLGYLGKEGGSGGWAHLHYEIISRQPSGKWGTEAAYALVWEAYLREYDPPLVAVARPHQLAAAGETVVLDGARSWARSGVIRKYRWMFVDGTEAIGPRVTRKYSRPGSYSEILRVEDDLGNISWDVAVVQVLDPVASTRKPQQLPPTIHAAYYPTFGNRAGAEIVFKVRTFRTTHGDEVWDFGDGTPSATVRSDGNLYPRAKDGYATVTHTYKRPGDYLVRVERANERGEPAIGHLHVRVDP